MEGFFFFFHYPFIQQHIYETAIVLFDKANNAKLDQNKTNFHCKNPFGLDRFNKFIDEETHYWKIHQYVFALCSWQNVIMFYQEHRCWFSSKKKPLNIHTGRHHICRNIRPRLRFQTNLYCSSSSVQSFGQDSSKITSE